jgi:hypothetical protein
LNKSVQHAVAASRRLINDPDAADELWLDCFGFKGWFIHPVHLNTWTRDPSQVAKEYSYTSRGLLLTEEGNWQFIWKVLKDYKSTFIILFVKLAKDSQSLGLQLLLG